MRRIQDDVRNSAKPFPSEDGFLKLSEKYGLVMIEQEAPLQNQTLLEFCKKIRKSKGSTWTYLFEEGASGAHAGRYSFLGFHPLRTYRVTEHRKILIEDEVRGKKYFIQDDLLQVLSKDLADLNPSPTFTSFPYSGGAMGFFGYEMIEEWEELFHDRSGGLARPPYPAAGLMIPGSLVVVDFVEQTWIRAELVPIFKGQTLEERRLSYHTALERLNKPSFSGTKGESLGCHTKNSLERPKEFVSGPSLGSFCAKSHRCKFLDEVQKAKRYIQEGDACQIVLSQDFVLDFPDFPAEDLYEALKAENPSPYHFLVSTPEVTLVGASPEILVRVEGRKVISRPLAGTRPRGRTLEEDLSLEKALLSDEKEHAEHAMLVDLARNDLAKVCLPDSIQVSDYMRVERFSKVMHLSSQVEGILSPEKTSLEALRATFPAGTVSGAPKIRAMERISEIERDYRGPYAGCVGFVDFCGNLDMCITIRTFEMFEKKVRFRVGAGIVIDSDPMREYEETLHKAEALFLAAQRVQAQRTRDSINKKRIKEGE